MGKWKGIRLNVQDNPHNPIELYDLETDPSENKNIAADFPDVVEKINQIMEDARTPSEHFPLFE